MYNQRDNRSYNPAYAQLPERLLEEAKEGGYLDTLLHTPLIVGVSGGPDSVAMLHALITLRGVEAPDTLVAAHYDHGLREESKQDLEFIKQLTAKWQLPFFSGSGNVAEMARGWGTSIEDAARKARYAFFSELAASRPLPARKESWAVAVAHTADDQAETVLMSILRGSGLTGLGGMQIVSHVPLALETQETETGKEEPATAEATSLFRPMLAVWRTEVENYITQNSIPSVEDQTNKDMSFTRNRVRHHLLPLLRSYNSGIKAHLVTLARIASVENSFVEKTIDKNWLHFAHLEDDSRAVRIDESAFASLDLALQLRVIRRATSALSGSTRDLDFTHTSGAARLLASANYGAFYLGNGMVAEKRPYWTGIRREESTAPIQAAVQKYSHDWPLLDPETKLTLLLDEPVRLESGWICGMEVQEDAAEEISRLDGYTSAFDLDVLGNGPLALRTRQKGDRISLLGMSGSKSLKELYIDAKIPHAVRDRVAVLAHSENNEVLWVPGPTGYRSAIAAIGNGTRALIVKFSRNR